MSHRLFHFPILAAIMFLLSSGNATTQLTPSPFALRFTDGGPLNINWPSASDRYYDLWFSPNLTDWAPVDGFPKAGTGSLMEEYFHLVEKPFFRPASWPDLVGYFYLEVVACKASTGITVEAANMGLHSHILHLPMDARRNGHSRGNCEFLQHFSE